MIDILLCYVPKSDMQSPLIGLPIIKSVLSKHGYSSKILDFNMTLYKQYRNILNADNWDDVDSIFIEQNNELSQLNNLYNQWADEILSHNPKFVGFSAFSDHNTYSIELLSKKIKIKNKDIKIIIGGPNTKWVYKSLLSQNLIDYYIIGYGEDAILKIMNNSFINIHSAQPNINLSTVPIPDFSDYNFNDFSSENLFYTYFTRGCTQSCKFCDVTEMWNTFNTRNTKSVINEMTVINAEYKFARFAFCDSLINGDMPLLRSLCIDLAEKDFKWEGMFRIRKTSDDDFLLLKHAGCYLLKIGIESGSVSLRRQMGKYFSDELIFRTLSQLNDVGIRCDLFFITGYMNETDQDHSYTKQLINKLAESNFRGCISNIRISPMYLRKDELQIHHTNPGYLKRFERFYDLQKFIHSIGFSIRRAKKMETSIKSREKLNS